MLRKNRIFAALLVGMMGLFVALCLDQAHAWRSGSSGVGSSCPFSTHATDGCDGATSFVAAGGAEIHTNYFLGYANGSGQPFNFRPQRNVAGVEYGVGASTATKTNTTAGGSADPTINANLPSGCTYNSGTNHIGCVSAGASPVFQHLNFGMNPNHAGTNCVRVIMTSNSVTAGGKVKFVDDYWKDNSGCEDGSGTFFVGTSGTVAYTPEFDNVTFDGNFTILPTLSCWPNNCMANDVSWTSSDTQTFTTNYVACLNTGARCFEPNVAGNITYNYSYVENLWGGVGAHAEFAINNVDPTTQSVTVSNANPAVITMTNTFAAGDPFDFSACSCAGSGIASNVTYFVLAAGLSGSSFEFSTTPGGSPVATTGATTPTIRFTLNPTTLTANYPNMVQLASLQNPSTTALDSFTEVNGAWFSAVNINSPTLIANKTMNSANLSFASLPTNGQTITFTPLIGSPSVWTFVTSGATGNQVNISTGGTTQQNIINTVAALVAALNASSDAAITVATYAVDSAATTTMYITSTPVTNQYTVGITWTVTGLTKSVASTGEVMTMTRGYATQVTVTNASVDCTGAFGFLTLSAYIAYTGTNNTNIVDNSVVDLTHCVGHQ